MASASTSSSCATLLGRQHFSFNEWMNLQELDLTEMLQAQSAEENCVDNKDVIRRELIEKNIQHFQAYAQQRTRLAHDHVSPYFSPPWCSFLEGSLLWITGCRPSLFIRLIYALSGLEIEEQIREMLEEAGRINANTSTSSRRLSELSISSRQLSMINELQVRTIKREEKLSEEMACLQEKIADQPVAPIAVVEGRGARKEQIHEALDEHSRAMVRMLEEADKLRISTLKELLEILSPVQALDFLIASKKLHICIHQWGKERDGKHS